MFLPEPTYQYDFIAYLDSGMGMIAILYLLVSTSISSLLVYPASTLFFFSYYYCAFGSSPIFLYKTYGSYNSGFKYRMHSSPYLASKSYSSPSLASVSKQVLSSATRTQPPGTLLSGLAADFHRPASSPSDDTYPVCFFNGHRVWARSSLWSLFSWLLYNRQLSKFTFRKRIHWLLSTGLLRSIHELLDAMY